MLNVAFLQRLEQVVGLKRDLILPRGSAGKPDVDSGGHRGLLSDEFVMRAVQAAVLLLTFERSGSQFAHLTIAVGLTRRMA